MTRATIAAPHFTQRVFAELPYSKTWREVRQHVARLAGACVTGFFSHDGEPLLDFTYKKHHFRIRKRNAWFEFCADDSIDLDATLMHVQEHFASLLSRPLATDSDGAFGRLHTARVAAC